MNRREFITTLEGSALALASASLFTPDAFAQSSTKIKVGQIGTGHAHASGKIATFRKLSEHFEIVGIVEPDAKKREAAQKTEAYQGLTWLTEEQLLNTRGLQAVAVETEVKDLLSTAEKCIAAGKHIHLDKPAGENFAHRRAGAQTEAHHPDGLYAALQSGDPILPSRSAGRLAGSRVFH